MKRKAVLLVLLTSGLSAIVHSQQPAAASTGIDLVVHITGFKHTRGSAMARLFVAGESLRGPGHASQRAEIGGTEATITFPSLAPGEYAVIAAHDENDNGEVDHGMFGPSEPLGFSNGFRLRRLRLSFPSFKKLRFELTPDHNRIEVALQ